LNLLNCLHLAPSEGIGSGIQEKQEGLQQGKGVQVLEETLWKETGPKGGGSGGRGEDNCPDEVMASHGWLLLLPFCLWLLSLFIKKIVLFETRVHGIKHVVMSRHHMAGPSLFSLFVFLGESMAFFIRVFNFGSLLLTKNSSTGTCERWAALPGGACI
jgi:hypothetical protein